MIHQDKLIEEPYNKYKLMQFLKKKLNRAGLSNVDIQRTPVMTRITVETSNPARVIGRKGRNVKKLTETVKEKFDIDNPQISVVEVDEPYLEPRLVAKKATNYIEMGRRVR